ncbi:uncharacterized protein TNCV_1366631 [Trichonephila clavipes]|nr:uncharacterized protein TNCV_1366631 [Trichonephila clavipes]
MSWTPVPLKIRRAEAADARQICRGLNILPLVWCGSSEMELPDQQQEVIRSVLWLATLTAVPLGLGSNPGEDMDVCNCIVPSRHAGTLNSRRAASPLVRLVEGEERWEATDHPQGILPRNWGETEPNRSVTCMMHEATANDRRHLALCRDEFRGS